MQKFVDVSKNGNFSLKEVKGITTYLNNLSKRDYLHGGYVYNELIPDKYFLQHNSTSSELDKLLKNLRIKLIKPIIDTKNEIIPKLKSFHFSRKYAIPYLGIKSKDLGGYLDYYVDLYSIYDFLMVEDKIEFYYTISKYRIKFSDDYNNEKSIKSLMSFQNIEDVIKNSESHTVATSDYIKYNSVNEYSQFYKPVIAEKPGYIYLMEDCNYYKIGKSANPKDREKKLITGNADIKLLHKIQTNNMNILESHTQKCFKKYKYKNEWFHKHSDILNYFINESDKFIKLR